MNRNEARELAKAFKIKGYSKLNAKELISAVEEAQINAAMTKVGVVPAGDLMVKESDFRDPVDGKITFNSSLERSLFFANRSKMAA